MRKYYIVPFSGLNIDRILSMMFAARACLLVAGLLAASVQASSRDCRCFPGDACWPSDHEWARFNQSIDGKLVTTVPLGAPCHEPNYDPEACDALREAWQLPEVQ